MTLHDAFKVVPLLMPVPVLELLIREVEIGDTPDALKKELIFVLHSMLEQQKTKSFFPYELDKYKMQQSLNISPEALETLAESLDFDEEELLEFIQKQTGLDKNTIMRVLDAETEFFERRENHE